MTGHDVRPILDMMSGRTGCGHDGQTSCPEALTCGNFSAGAALDMMSAKLARYPPLHLHLRKRSKHRGLDRIPDMMSNHPETEHEE